MEEDSVEGSNQEPGESGCEQKEEGTVEAGMKVKALQRPTNKR